MLPACSSFYLRASTYNLKLQLFAKHRVHILVREAAL